MPHGSNQRVNVRRGGSQPASVWVAADGVGDQLDDAGSKDSAFSYWLHLYALELVDVLRGDESGEDIAVTDDLLQAHRTE